MWPLRTELLGNLRQVTREVMQNRPSPRLPDWGVQRPSATSHSESLLHSRCLHVLVPALFSI